MTATIDRRDFLKLAAVAALTPLVRFIPAGWHGAPPPGTARPNVILILFDALSAAQLGLYGYKRQTSPNLERLAGRATVYHNHHSAGNFTTPSTASLFTATYPWTHRAFTLNSLISPEVEARNLFQWLGERYYQVGFAQNIFADMLLYQTQEHMSRHVGPDSYAITGGTLYDKLFQKDAIAGMKSYDQFLFKRDEMHGALFLSLFNDVTDQINLRLASARLAGAYPDGLPRLANTDVYFTIQQVLQGVQGLLGGLPAPFFAYLHFMPPHAPYQPERSYVGRFKDGWKPKPKKNHPLGSRVAPERLNELRQTYDEYVANLDAEFGRLLDYLEKSGLLENSYVILTSDHGELFERGVHGHTSPLLYEPAIHIPLLISAPGQRARQDVHALTSNVDLAPTLLQLAGVEIPPGLEGQPLPGLETAPGVSTERSIFCLEAQKNLARQPLTKTSLALVRGRYKLLHSVGYRYEGYEFYDLESDPEEIDDQYPAHPLAKELQAELDEKLKQVNRPYITG